MHRVKRDPVSIQHLAHQRIPERGLLHWLHLGLGGLGVVPNHSYLLCFGHPPFFSPEVLFSGSLYQTMLLLDMGGLAVVFHMLLELRYGTEACL